MPAIIARVRYAVRILAWITGALAIPVALGGMAGQVGALVGAAVAVVVTLWLWLWLPRSAHAAAEAGTGIWCQSLPRRPRPEDSES